MEVCAGIVLYHPNIDRLKQSIKAVQPQVDKLVLVSNAPEDIQSLKEAFPEDDFVWIENDKNIGIAAALNQILEFAHENGYLWVLTLDQDGVCGDDLVEKLHTAALDYGNTAMASPRVIEHGVVWEDAYSKRLGKNAQPLPAVAGYNPGDAEEVSFCITSGTLTNTEAVLSVGGFCEKLFIDEVDRDICIRLRYRGYRILRVNTAELEHEFGIELIERKILFKRYRYRNYSPFRVYYQIRNMVYMVRKYGADYKPYPAWRLIRPFFSFFVKFIFEPQRFKRLSAFIRGYAAGLVMEVT